MAVVLPNLPTQAQSVTFACGMSDEVPTTIAVTERGNISVIRWVSEFGHAVGYTPQQRCQEVSSRFQTYHELDVLNYLTTGSMNGQSVICVTLSPGASCDRNLVHQGLLFTLKPDSDGEATLQRLIAVRDYGDTPLNESTHDGVSRSYINMNELLRNAPIDPDATLDASPASPIW